MFEDGADRPATVIDTAEVILVATDTANTGGETLAASALRFWRLPIEPGAARMRALVAGAANSADSTCAGCACAWCSSTARCCSKSPSWTPSRATSTPS